MPEHLYRHCVLIRITLLRLVASLTTITQRAPLEDELTTPSLRLLFAGSAVAPAAGSTPRYTRCGFAYQPYRLFFLTLNSLSRHVTANMVGAPRSRVRRYAPRVLSARCLAIDALRVYA